MKQFIFLPVLLLGALVLLPGQASAAPPCALADAPTCGGECPPGEMCVDVDYPGPPGGVLCECVPAPMACGDVEGPPLCYGGCPPGLACVDMGPMCVCDPVPTLSEWGIMGMSVLMFGGVIYLRRRRQEIPVRYK